MTRDELKEQIDELMREYADEEIDGASFESLEVEGVSEVDGFGSGVGSTGSTSTDSVKYINNSAIL